ARPGTSAQRSTDRAQTCPAPAQVSDRLPLREREVPGMERGFQRRQGRNFHEGGHACVVVHAAAIGIDPGCPVLLHPAIPVLRGPQVHADMSRRFPTRYAPGPQLLVLRSPSMRTSTTPSTAANSCPTRPSVCRIPVDANLA